MAKRIGEVLKRAREKKSLRADDVAILCNVTRGRYYQWEAADYILRKNLPMLAKALDLNLRYLIRLNNEGRERVHSDDGGEHNTATAA